MPGQPNRGAFRIAQLEQQLEDLTPKDALECAVERADEALQSYFREVVTSVDYSTYSREFTVNEFRCALRMALRDLWGFERHQQAGALGLDGFAINMQGYVAAHPAYERLCNELLDCFEQQTRPRPYRDWVAMPREQQRIYQNQRALALYATDPKVREFASRALGEKMSPTVKVKDETRRIVHVDLRTAELLDQTLRWIQERRDARTIETSPGDPRVQPAEAQGAAPRERREPLLLRAGDPSTQPPD